MSGTHGHLTAMGQSSVFQSQRSGALIHILAIKMAGTILIANGEEPQRSRLVLDRGDGSKPIKVYKRANKNAKATDGNKATAEDSCLSDSTVSGTA